jgi:hypothetical protein
VWPARTVVVVEIDVLDGLAIGSIKTPLNYLALFVAPHRRAVRVADAWQGWAGHYLVLLTGL